MCVKVIMTKTRIETAKASCILSGFANFTRSREIHAQRYNMASRGPRSRMGTPSFRPCTPFDP